MQTDSVAELTHEEYGWFRDLVYEKAGINLGDKKMQLVRARLGKRLRAGAFKSYRAYYEHVKADASGEELTLLIDAISTNTTHLFREKNHFTWLEEAIGRWMSDTRQMRSPIRIWSAGCSSGEEPYTIAMVMDNLTHQYSSLKFKILATDISTRMLDQARRGAFDSGKLAQVPSEFKRRYFAREGPRGEERMLITPETKKLITFARLNLMDAKYPFRNPMDIIFCRNVMIYFDRPTQEALVAKYANALSAGGYLLIGHSESLNNIKHPFSYIAPTIYQKRK